MIEKQAGTGRTPWDFATELLVVLGRIGPSAIIVGGFLVFSFLFYQEINKVRLDTDKLLQEKTETAQNQLVETYQRMGGMSSQLISNIDNLLKLRREIDVEIGKTKTEVHAAETQVKRLKTQLNNQTVTSILFQGMRNDLNTFVDGVYLPFQLKHILKNDFRDYETDKTLSLFSAMDTVVKQPKNQKAKEDLEEMAGVFVQILIEEVEHYRQRLLVPLNRQEKSMRSAIFDDGALENIRNISNKIAEITKSESRAGTLDEQTDKIMRIYERLESN